jgi:hypothetical protein
MLVQVCLLLAWNGRCLMHVVQDPILNVHDSQQLLLQDLVTPGTHCILAC